MKSNEITLEKKDSIATLKFNRPEAFNAVNTTPLDCSTIMSII